MSLEWIHIVHAKVTEGAQEGLLCVHTTDVCIHCTFCLWGNVAVPTLVHILVGPQLNHYGCLNEFRSRCCRSASCSISSSSSIGSVFTGVEGPGESPGEAGVGVITLFSCLKSWGNSPGPTSSHVCPLSPSCVQQPLYKWLKMHVLTVSTWIQLNLLHSVQTCVDSVNIEQNTFNTVYMYLYLLSTSVACLCSD